MANKTFEEKTREIKPIILRAEKSARDAWRVGKILSEIKTEKEYKKKYNTFAKYTQLEFKISESTANKYIDIFNNIPFEEIPEDFLLTHLYAIADMSPQLRKFMIEAMTDLQSFDGAGEYKQTEQTVYMVRKMIESIASTSKTQKGTHDFSKRIKALLKDELSKEKSRKARSSLPFEKGKPIESPHFEQITAIYPNEPVDEQGVVGLFCSIFFLIQKLGFDYEDRNLKFSKIVYVRTRFPDAKIEFFCHTKKRDTLTELNVEFEFDSRNYFAHKHNESTDKCELIICWEHTLDSQDMEMPPVLSLKDILATGNINIISVGIEPST
jgi:hypothetical protein